MSDMSSLISRITMLNRQRRQFQKAEIRLELQIQAICRAACDGEKDEAAKVRKGLSGEEEVAPDEDVLFAAVHLLQELQNMTKHRVAMDKAVGKLAKQLPVWAWAEQVAGLGEVTLGQIIGEAGDLSQYDNPSKLWKRFGLAVMPDGMAQRRVSGVDAIEHGFSPQRRAIIWNLQNSILRACGKPTNKITLRSVYDERKAYEAARNEEKAYSEQAAKLLKANKGATKASKELWEAGKLTPKHIDNRAKRFLGKSVLRELWAQWRAVTKAEPVEPLPSTVIPFPEKTKAA